MRHLLPPLNNSALKMFAKEETKLRLRAEEWENKEREKERGKKEL